MFNDRASRTTTTSRALQFLSLSEEAEGTARTPAPLGVKPRTRSSPARSPTATKEADFSNVGLSQTHLVYERPSSASLQLLNLAAMWADRSSPPTRRRTRGRGRTAPPWSQRREEATPLLLPRARGRADLGAGERGSGWCRGKEGSGSEGGCRRRRRGGSRCTGSGGGRRRRRRGDTPRWQGDEEEACRTTCVSKEEDREGAAMAPGAVPLWAHSHGARSHPAQGRERRPGEGGND
jgi:hypothetical protein